MAKDSETPSVDGFKGPVSAPINTSISNVDAVYNTVDGNNFLIAYGADVIANGYDIVPVAKGSKAPKEKGWSSIKADNALLAKWCANGYKDGGGVGVLASRFPGIDIDVLDKDMSDRMARLVMDKLGFAPKRYGKHPKCLLMYYTRKPFKKKQSSLFKDKNGNDARVEVLCDGQQYVIFHTHPDTGTPYFFDGLSPLDITAFELSEINEDQAIAICQEFDVLANEAGWKKVRQGNCWDGFKAIEGEVLVNGSSGSPTGISNANEIDRLLGLRVDEDITVDDPALANAQKCYVTLERAEQIIFSMMDMNVLHDDWVLFGMALHHEFDGDESALELWDRWSIETTGTYEHEECAVRWRSFNNEQTTRALKTFRAVLKLYKERGGDSILVDGWVKRIDACSSKEDLIKRIVPDISAAVLDDFDLEIVAQKIKAAIKRIEGTSLPIKAVRKLMAKARPDTVDHKAAKAQAESMVGQYSFDSPLPVEIFPDVFENEETGLIRPKATVNNLEVLCDAYGISLSYDVILKKQEIIFPTEKSLLDDTSDLKNESGLQTIRSLLSLNNIPLVAADFLVVLMDRHSVNPLKEWITRREWDGTDRLQDLCDSVAVEDDNIEYRDRIIRLWLVQCVAAIDGAYETERKDAIPKYENVLVFRSDQGTKKTSWWRSLFSDDYKKYIKDGAHLEVSDKDSVLNAISCAICELGEIDATFRKSDQSRLKAFLSKTEDTIRLPFGRVACNFKRRTSYCATVNDDQFLIDTTGSRRFYPLNVLFTNPMHGVNMQQLWAQVWQQYKAGAQWWPDEALEEMLIPKRERHQEVDETEDVILNKFIFRQDDNGKWIGPSKGDAGAVFLSRKDIADEAGIQYNRRAANRITAVLKKYGVDEYRTNTVRGFYLIRNDSSFKNLNEEEDQEDGAKVKAEAKLEAKTKAELLPPPPIESADGMGSEDGSGDGGGSIVH